ncbi:ferric reductase like transmembrane component-domain-containing protein [Apiospora phragmitis]|uniref:Ferric reductase like transmembrane component-domain-containing protein n=1 Tax=Apiospora phragmitis TaxID=2905665 RepID=A0ABR1U6H2_9PEZI
MADIAAPLSGRHIQNLSEATAFEKHWGYPDRALPCTNDAGSCAYLDLVYHSHDVSMLYAGILWAVVSGILLVWAFGRKLWPSRRADEVLVLDSERFVATTVSRGSRVKRTAAALVRSYLLPDSVRAVFGRTTRLQVLILAVCAGYLLIFSLVGLVYETWVTPVKKMPGVYNTRTSLGPWSDRIGILAYALTPFSIMLSSRESILSLLTGVPYQSFNFLHRWLGYIICIQGLLHTISWTVIEAYLYQPQPSVAAEWIAQTYMIWGCVAIILLLLIFVLSLPPVIRLTGYEFFRKAHYVLAMIYIGACYAHWDKLSCFMIPALVLWFLDRAVRLVRTGLAHYQILPDGKTGFKTAQATLTHFPDAEHGDILRLDFAHSQEAWQIGQHFYLCFPECSIWQSHPFTPLNLPELRDGVVEHSYIVRAKKGETKKLADRAAAKLAENAKATTPVVISGSYGESITDHLTPDVNVLCVAGGTGITYVLPVLLSLIAQPGSKNRKIELIWAIRKKPDMQWVQKELDAIHRASRTHGVVVHIFVTRESSSPAPSLRDEKKTGNEDPAVKEVGASSSKSSTASSASVKSMEVRKLGGSENFDTHPDLEKIVGAFVENTICGPTTVFASGPGGMVSDLRSIVAACNSGAQVWKGNERYDVGLTCDDRLEW